MFYDVLLCAADKLESFLRQFPDFPNAFLVGGPADFFVTELADQVKMITLCSIATPFGWNLRRVLVGFISMASPRVFFSYLRCTTTTS